MKLINVPKHIYEQYRATVRGSEDISLDETRRKFTRNKYLSLTKLSHQKNRTYYMYGRFHFIVDKNNTVVWMNNKRESPVGWERDNKLFMKLNKQLGIRSEITELGLVVRDKYLNQVEDVNGIRWKIDKKTVLGLFD